MYSTNSQLAENKLLVLYILKKIGHPISNNILTQIMLENNVINYFTLQQYIVELVSSNFLELKNFNGKQRLSITKTGIKVLNLFDTRISKEKIELMNNYIKKNIEYINEKILVKSNYTVDKDNAVIVYLKAFKGIMLIADIKLTVQNENDAKIICSNWQKKYSDVCSKITGLLLKD